MEIKLPNEVIFLLSEIEKYGYEAFVVGGGVRDMLLKKTPTDFDITTNALPVQIKEIFKNYLCIDIGEKFGTITVFVNNIPFEITTYRKEISYINNRFPKNVIFSNSVYDDLKRRDFTINAILCSKDNTIIDIYNGMQDLSNKIIKCIGNPNIRFNEDALRILRCIRFSAHLNFDIEKDTEFFMIENRGLLNNISKERIQNEFNKIILSDNYFKVIQKYSTIFDEIINDFSKKVFLNCNIIEQDLCLRLAIIFSNYKYQELLDILKSLKYDNKTIKVILILNSTNLLKLSGDKKYIKYLMFDYGLELTKKIILYHFYTGKITNIDLYNHNVDYILNNNECYSLKQLSINGKDIKENFNIQNKEIGKVLKKVLSMVIEGKIENNKMDIFSNLLTIIDEDNNI